MKNRISIYPSILTALFLLIITGCDKDVPNVPVLVTYEVKDITISSANVKGKIKNDFNTIIKHSGFCISTDKCPKLFNSICFDLGSSYDLEYDLTNLKSKTTYFVRAYANNESGTGYGNIVSFTTLPGGSSDSVIDIDGNIYHSVIIGTQIWMVENLKVIHYRNGDAIPCIADDNEWIYLSTNAYCDYQNDNRYRKNYGVLYNWFTINDNRKIAPNGWHVPSDEEWNILINYLGGENVAGGKLKDKNDWYEPNSGATNEWGFTALAGGYRDFEGLFVYKRFSGIWWSSTQISSKAYFRAMSYDRSNIYRNYDLKSLGFSVKCIKDN